MSSASSLIRCFWRMITTSDAVHVAAARSNVSTGDVAVRESPSTRIGGRPFPSPSNCSCCFHRTLTSAVRGGATSVPSARRQTHIHPMPMYHIEGAVFHQPIECRAIMQLEAEGEIGPQTGTVWIGGTTLAPRDRETGTDVRRGELLLLRESPQNVETADVRVRTVEDADLRGWPQPNPVREQIPHVQRRAEHELAGAAQVHTTADTEAEESDARAPVRRALGRHELLRASQSGDE